MAQASESKLVALHEVIAEVIASQVTATEEYLDEQGEEVSLYTASPALIAVAVKFLKDNSITCAIEEDENLGKLEEIFANKQRKGRLALSEVAH